MPSMQLVDWLVMLLPLLISLGLALYSRRYVRSVADFMAGGRNAGRYLIMAARSEQGAGAVVFVAAFQVFAVSGFTLHWWHLIAVPVGLLLTITGFVIYRYRETRAMTLAQFFEMRYSRRFRIFAGGLGFFAGLVNFGIIPVVGARFMVYFMGLPPETHILMWMIPTHLLLMGGFLTMCVITTTLGGQITVLLTDCAEGMFSQVFYILIVIILFFVFFSWGDTKAMLLDTQPGHSLVNPFDSSGLKDFNIWYVLMGIYMGIYGTMAWQNSHAFNASAATPHEARMGAVLGKWRGIAIGLMITVLVVCALTYLHTADGAAAVDASLAQISDPSVANQMRVPIALSYILPVGVKGMLLAVCLMGIIAGDGIHLHSWSSIFIQDLVMPLRKKPLTPRQHINLLRCAIVGVAIFAFVFGALFPLIEYVQLWWSVTQAIFTGGAGAAIIGGLYWSRGTNAGAWTGLIIGSTLAVSGICVRLYCQKVLGHEFWLNGLQISFFASLISVTSYVIVSLLTCKVPHDMDRLLHRGEYAVSTDVDAASRQHVAKPRNWLCRAIGIDEHYTRTDRWITLGIASWSMFWFAVFGIGSVGYLIHPWSNASWGDYWFVTAICLPLVIAVATTVWFTIGCWRDMRLFFRRLREERIDSSDDGSVRHDLGRPRETDSLPHERMHADSQAKVT